MTVGKRILQDERGTMSVLCAVGVPPVLVRIVTTAQTPICASAI